MLLVLGAPGLSWNDGELFCGSVSPSQNSRVPSTSSHWRGQAKLRYGNDVARAKSPIILSHDDDCDTRAWRGVAPRPSLSHVRLYLKLSLSSLLIFLPTTTTSTQLHSTHLKDTSHSTKPLTNPQTHQHVCPKRTRPGRQSRFRLCSSPEGAGEG